MVTETVATVMRRILCDLVNKRRERLRGMQWLLCIDESGPSGRVRVVSLYDGICTEVSRVIAV